MFDVCVEHYYAVFGVMVSLMDLIDWIKQKEKEMEENMPVVNVQNLARDAKYHVYFALDIASGDMTMFFNCPSVEVAVRSFCMSLDTLPESLVKDFVLVDGETRDVVFEGRQYLETWQKKRDHLFVLSNKKGVVNA